LSVKSPVRLEGGSCALLAGNPKDLLLPQATDHRRHQRGRFTADSSNYSTDGDTLMEAIQCVFETFGESR
jgi:hypothetical protein